MNNVITLHPTPGIEVRFLDEDILNNFPGRIIVFQNNRVISEVTAHIERKLGADMDCYTAVVFKKKT